MNFITEQTVIFSPYKQLILSLYSYVCHSKQKIIWLLQIQLIWSLNKRLILSLYSYFCRCTISHFFAEKSVDYVATQTVTFVAEHFNVSVTVRDKVTRQCPQTTTFEEKAEPNRNRTEVLLLTSLPPYR